MIPPLTAGETEALLPTVSQQISADPGWLASELPPLPNE